MTLSQKLGKRYPTPYSLLFADFNAKVVRRLATLAPRAVPPRKRMPWSRQIGSTEIAHSKQEWRDGLPVEQRVAALLGTAEGILERQGWLSIEPQNAWP